MLRLPALVVLLASFNPCGAVHGTGGVPVLGTFTVDVSLDSNTCGYGGLALPAYVQRTAEVGGYAGEAATFTWTDSGSRQVSGSASSTGTYRFVDEATTELIAADPVLGTPACKVVQHTEVVFTLSPVTTRPTDAGASDAGPSDAGSDAGTQDAGPSDGGVQAMTLTGTLTIDVVPSGGSYCTPLLGTNGGPFAALPCVGRMDLNGTLAQ